MKLMRADFVDAPAAAVHGFGILLELAQVQGVLDEAGGPEALLPQPRVVARSLLPTSLLP